ncbi:hypothetical protein N0V84_004767 [Fusarium piperis]|uniref:Ankyrin repeat protein n=1 Tax=Fusarium piperis TaxID=1435070 RepID=A0A9W9BR68_9HYPO|nr:hypothetical protein N0V84_004767 [Fusarium piperis]
MTKEVKDEPRGETPLHKLLSRMKESQEPTSSADLDELSRILAGGAQVDAKDTDGETALHLAAANGLLEAAEKLINAGAKVSELDNEGQQPLHKACSEGHVQIVNQLLNKGADTQIVDTDGWSPLHLASRYGHTEVIRALLEKDKRNIDATEKFQGWTALNVAVYKGHDEAVSILLDQGASVSIQDDDGWTPLMTATKRKHEEILTRLLAQGGDLELETRSKSGHTPLLAASINGFEAGVRLLIEKGADSAVQSTRSKCTPLIAASDWRYSKIVRTLLEANSEGINTQDKYECTALHDASSGGSSKVVEILLEYRADVEKVNDVGQTALHLASKNGYEAVVRQLLEAGATVDATDNAGETALHLASGARLGDYEPRDESELGPDDLSLEDQKKTEFSPNQHAAVVELLLKHKAKPDAKTNKNETALHLAAARGDSGRLGPILDKMEQQHMSIKNNQGRTALFLACTGDRPDSALECLLKSDKLRTAEFGRSDDEDDEIAWAASYPETHGIAKKLLEKRPGRRNEDRPGGSDKWSAIEWAAYSQLPEVLLLLIAGTLPTPELKAELESVALHLKKKAQIHPQDPESTKGSKAQKEDLEKTENRREKADYRRVVEDILRDPPFLQTHKDSRMDWPPKRSGEQSEILEEHEATIVRFYEGKGESGTLQRYRSLEEVIYGQGPGEIVKNTISDLENILKGRPGLPYSFTDPLTEPKFTWVHLPATNHMLFKIREDEDCGLDCPPYHELNSFFRDSWTQVPDRTSSSRSMRPRTVVMRRENKTDEGEGKMNNPDLRAASATYMPYFCFSAQDGPDKDKFKKMEEAYKALEESANDKNHRNNTQVVTRAMEGNKSTKGGDKILIRVNQLLMEGILEQLRKEAEVGGTASQPKSAVDMSRFIIDYCIGSYERLAKGGEPKSHTGPQGPGSIRQIFSNAINKIVRHAPEYVRDELNILKSAAQHQKTAEEGFLLGNPPGADLTAAYVVNDLKEMDNSAERIQYAINTTLSLLQSNLSNDLADLAAEQGKTLMAFTVVTILFVSRTPI